jgi:hypothetical protein
MSDPTWDWTRVPTDTLRERRTQWARYLPKAKTRIREDEGVLREIARREVPRIDAELAARAAPREEKK